MIARIFPRKTKASPNDNLSFFDLPPFFLPKITEVHISVAFTWDLEKSYWLAYQWQNIAPVKLGGPAFGQPSGEFHPGMYLKEGYTITSRGCHNKCWFCSVWKREPALNELKIKPGSNVLDDNLLACSSDHIKKVFQMLKAQRNRAEFTGGLEAALLKPWHVDLLVDLKPKQMFFAYDEPRDYEPLMAASKMLVEAGFNRQQMRCYVLVGYPGDTLSAAEYRLKQCLKISFFPMAMLWRNEKGKRESSWLKFQKYWSRPAFIYCQQKQEVAA